MDKVYTCICGCKVWVIENGQVTCTECNKVFHTHYEGRYDSFMTPEDFNRHIRIMESSNENN